MKKLTLAMLVSVAMVVLFPTGTCAQNEKPDRVFIIRFCTRDIAEFAEVAALAEKLKPYGAIRFDVGNLAEKSRHDVPRGGSPWHEYASYNPAPYKFFPPKKLAPFIPAAHVAKNRQMLKAKLAILRKHGYGAAFWAYEPNFWPEEFFRKYPHLRGARSDHPRRSRAEAFPPCVDRPEVLEMIAESTAALVKAAPELKTYSFKTNDAGPGLCWSYWLYSGPNGPAHCRHRNMGLRVRGLLEAIAEGAKKSGGELHLSLSSGMFSDEERLLIRKHLPEGVTFGWSSDQAYLGTRPNSFYPVKGIINPLSVLRSVRRLSRPSIKKVFLNFRVSYDRGGELAETVEFMFDMIDGHMKDPVPGGLIERLGHLKELCGKWGGEKHADALFGALVGLDEAMKYRRAAFGGIRTLYSGVSARHITRPLVAMPNKLSPDEEAYFLPHVFNPNENEGRMDYIDIHGGRMVPVPMVPTGQNPKIGAVGSFRSRIDRVCRTLENLDGAPKEKFFRQMALSLRIYCSVLRSVNNFYATQIVRDRNKDKLMGPQRIPSKISTRTGDKDLLLLNDYMRDELDNTAELIKLLENGGMARVTHATRKEDEDTFLLGPDLVAQLRKKMDIMRKHWLDASRHMATPFK